MPKAWKVAPGDKAKVWSECQAWECIIIGWKKLGDYSRFKSKKAIQSALLRSYPARKSGNGPRATNSVWRFLKEIQPKHVIFANDGRDTVVGIGVVESDYLPPNSATNPSQHEWYQSARRVDWRVTKSVQLGKNFFVQDTVWPLQPSQCEEIRQAYVEQHPALRKTLAGLLEGLESHVTLDDRIFASESDVEGLRIEYLATKATRSRRLRNKALHLANGVFEVCRRDFSKFLNGRGQRALQVHHCNQLSAREVPSVTKLADLVVVCSNCHLLLHLDARTTMTVNQLRDLLKNDSYLES